MEEFRTPSRRPSHRETLANIRRDIQKLRQEQRQEQRRERNETPEEGGIKKTASLRLSPLRLSPLLPNPKEEKNLNEAEEKEREREHVFAPSPSETVSTPSASSVSENGWNQGDGRRADQFVAYERLPKSVRERIEPAKGTHFRFRHSSEEQALLQALTTATQKATYHATGKKDITLTTPDGRLLGNIHFLHMDSRDIHRPEKYYMKFYLFNFSDSGVLRDTKQRLLSFTQTFLAPSRPSHSSRPSQRKPHRAAPAHRNRTRRVQIRRNRTRRT